MQLAHVLSAVLSVQAQAASVGVAVDHYVARTQQALCLELSRLPALVSPPDPDDVDDPSRRPRSAYDPEPHDAIMCASRCRALLLEVIRRAAHDWVLYRGTRRPERVFAKSAYTWLFEEKPGHPDWETRQREGEPLMAFLAICENLDLDPEVVRRRVKQLTVRDIMTAGRPAETRKVAQDGVEDYAAPSEIELVSLDDPGSGASSHYEAHFAVHTY